MLRSILATDCGSTTTKAILIERQDDGSYRLTARGEAPTTVEAPFEDVTQGVFSAAREVSELRGRELIARDEATGEESLIRPQEGERGVDAYISTSSAGGGLQMIVGGVVKSMTTESAVRAALGAGAIVMDAFSSNDGRAPHEKVERVRELRPDMILLAGGIDGGTEKHVIELVEMISAANPKPRLGIGFHLPLVYAGNTNVADRVREVIGNKVELTVVSNVRPTLEHEDLHPAREAIHDLFLEHVMQQAPGYGKLTAMTDAPIVPTPGAVGSLIERVAKMRGIEVLGVDIGGATTDVFSVFRGKFNRTVSANLGMSYSVSNVLAEAGLANILRWVPFRVDERELRSRIGNKMIRPTTIPVSLDDLQLEQAIAREALRLSLVQHREFATELRGVQKERTIADAFRQTGSGNSLVNMMTLDLIIGSGGVLSHAPRRAQSFRMMLDAFEPEGVTTLAVDSIFMMPHLGVLSTIHPEAAAEVFERDCLVWLGTAVAPVGEGADGQVCLTMSWKGRDGSSQSVSLRVGELRLVPWAEGDGLCLATITPARGFDIGAGPGVAIERELRGGKVGIVLDGRGRSIRIPHAEAERVEKLRSWSHAMDEYPEASS